MRTFMGSLPEGTVIIAVFNNVGELPFSSKIKISVKIELACRERHTSVKTGRIGIIWVFSNRTNSGFKNMSKSSSVSRFLKSRLMSAQIQPFITQRNNTGLFEPLESIKSYMSLYKHTWDTSRAAGIHKPSKIDIESWSTTFRSEPCRLCLVVLAPGHT